MIEEIARRLNRIADDCVQRMGAGGTSPLQGATAGPLLSPASQGMVMLHISPYPI